MKSKDSKNWRKKLVPHNTTVAASFSTLIQPFCFFRKLLAIIIIIITFILMQEKGFTESLLN